MSPRERHWQVATRILIGRALALKSGLPWSLEEDRELIARERFLWASLSPSEQEEEQAALANFWGERNRSRFAVADPSWGAWAANRDAIEIPDAAFGLPADSFRPWGKGIELLSQEHPKLTPLLTLLWEIGFQPAAVRGTTVILPILSTRIVQESERLAGVLGRTFPHAKVTPEGGKGVSLVAVYDVATGQAAIHLTGADQLREPA